VSGTFWRRRLLVPALVVAGLDLAVFAAYTLPRTLREQTLVGRGAALREEVRVERQRTEALRTRADTMVKNREDVKRFYSETLGPKSSLLEVQKEMDGLARELGLRAGNRSYAIEEVKGSDSLRRFQMTMQVKGSYRQLVSLLDRLERSPHFVTLDQVRLGRREAASAVLDLTLSAFFVETAPPGREARS
jgi:hypothetical protein